MCLFCTMGVIFFHCGLLKLLMNSFFKKFVLLAKQNQRCQWNAPFQALVVQVYSLVQSMVLICASGLCW